MQARSDFNFASNLTWTLTSNLFLGTKLIRLNNILSARLNLQPSAAPLQAWPSVSTVDGNEHWAEPRTQEQGDADEEMEVDQVQVQDRGPFAGPSRYVVQSIALYFCSISPGCLPYSDLLYVHSRSLTPNNTIHPPNPLSDAHPIISRTTNNERSRRRLHP